MPEGRADKPKAADPGISTGLVAQYREHKPIRVNTRRAVDLGNTQPGDGPRFKGRGLIQLTGRANYRDYSEFTGIDYVSDPNRIALDPVACVDVACWFWQHNGLAPLAEADDARAVTKRINGGYNGLDDRLEHLARAKALLGL